MARAEQFLTSDIVQCFATALHCWFVSFHTYDVSLKCWK